MNKSTLEHQIADDDKVLFIHIRKAAGTTLATILEQFFEPKEIAPFIRLSELAKIPPQVYDQYHYFRGHIHYDIMRLLLGTEPVCLTMLREPTERFMSEFAQWQRSPYEPEEIKEQISRMSLTEFVHGSKLVARPVFQNYQTRLIGGQFDIKNVKEVVTARNIQHHLQPLEIELTKKRLKTLVFVGLTERFQDSLFLLAYTFGWWPVIDFTSFHIASRRPRREQVPAETVAKIEEFNALDIELYACAQQLFESRFTQMTHELLERYGQRHHAHLTLPLSIEAMQDLLEKHYMHRHTQRHQPVSSVNIEFDRAISGTGWYLPEEHFEHRTYRWTGPGTCSTLYVWLTATSDVLIKFSILAAITPEVLASLKLSVNNHPVPLMYCSEDNGTILFEGRIPQAVLINYKGFVRLAFEVAQTIAPCTLDPNKNDDRPLGIAFNWLEINPA